MIFREYYTQAFTTSLRPRPSYPLVAIFEPVFLGLCNFETNIQENKTTSVVSMLMCKIFKTLRRID